MKSIRVAAGIIKDRDQVLITRRAPHEHHAGGWEFPGGKIEAGETPEACLARELKEELDIDVAVGGLCTNVTHNYGDVTVELIAYYCTIVAGELHMSVHDMCKWVNINDLLKYDLLPADVPIARKIMEEHN
ncbi:MAG TPA: 8-oxo-dGTP diphosphatase MutT [Limnochordia bacterium]|nr:8-oxo-dGTP diphosphatase MutT [Bacillota bacterium]NLH30879.1 8-oxo-dGTP diphosphatase MutT [Bacillota bacterium]HOB09897.1 8-oxo-dGTP diphosphatase MutT [Limnochordia bacterium]HPZ31841.1 8-oxo-dGTP diphosphatase MutT [Limnochordia bacterium]